MSNVSSMQKAISLVFLRNAQAEREYEMTLDDDIKKNNILLLKKGVHLNGQLLEKLLNFGVQEAYVNLVPIKIINKTDVVSTDLVRNQGVLVVHSDIHSGYDAERIFLKAGFSNQNIFLSSDANNSLMFLKNNCLMHIFIESSQFSQEFVDKLSAKVLLRPMNIFVINAFTLNEINKLSKIKTSNENLNIKILQKPLGYSYIKALINLSSTNRFSQL